MGYESFFLELDEVISRFTGIDLYYSMRDLGIQFRYFYGRLEIESIDNVKESELLQSQKSYFYEVLHARVGELMTGYFDEYPDMEQQEYPSAYLKDGRELVIPHDCHARYRYWLRECESSWKHLEKSLSLHDILKELNAPSEVIKRYIGQRLIK